MKITIEKIIIEGGPVEIKGLFTSEELANELTRHTQAKPQPEVIHFNSEDDTPENAETAPAATTETEAKPVAPAPTSETPAEGAEKKEKAITKEDIRAAMEAVRNKFEYGTPALGEAKGPNAEPDQQIHKNLTTLFKDTARRLGSERPSALPEEKRAEFIELINHFELHDDTIAPF